MQFFGKSEKKKNLKELVEKRLLIEEKEGVSLYKTHKTDINFCDINGYSLLHYAIEEGDLQKVTELVDAGADINLPTRTLLNEKKPIELALQSGHVEIANYLFNKGSDCSSVMLQTASTEACRNWFQGEIKKRIYKNYAPSEINLSLLKDENDPIFKERYESTQLNPLQRVSEIGDDDFLNKYIHPSSAEFYFDPEESKSNRLQIIDGMNPSLLNLAAANGQEEIITILLANKIPINPEKQFTTSALQAAIARNQLKTAEKILFAGGALNWLDFRKRTAIQIAIENNNEEAFNYLLAKNPDLLNANVEGNTLLHSAVMAGNAGILKTLLGSEKIQSILNQSNIYGQSVFDLAISTNNEELINLLSPYFSEQVRDKKAEPIINQLRVIQKVLYYYRLNYRDIDLLSLEGCCSGFTFLYLLYCSKNQENYFFDTLAIISNWNGDQEFLEKPFSPDMPQAKFYKNLGELLEQWSNDIVWFQQSTLHIFSQKERLEQFSMIDFDLDSIPVKTFESYELLKTNQIKELFLLFSKMPKGFCLELGGAKHATGAYIKDKDQLIYYDSNFKLRTTPLNHADALLQRVLDTKYISHKEYPGENERIDIEFYFYYFKKNEKDILNSKLFSDDELPKSQEGARLFQENSPNKMTQLQWAIMARSLESLKQLLNDNYCDINAKNSFGSTALQMAIKYKFDEAIMELMAHPDIDLKMAAYEAYNLNNKNLLQKIIANPQAQNLADLLVMAIMRGDLPLIEELISKNKVNLNEKNRLGALPLTVALQGGSEDIIHLLLKHKANVTLSSVDKPAFCSTGTPLEIAARKEGLNQEIYNLIINSLTDINQLDESGRAAIHYVTTIDVLKDLLNKGADIHLKNSDNKTFLDGISSGVFGEEKLKWYELIFSSSQFNVSKNKEDLDFLLTLLITRIRFEDKEAFDFILSDCNEVSLVINQHDEQGMMPLHYAILTEHFDFAKQLLEKGADINAPAKTQSRNTSFHILIKKEQIENIEYLLQHFDCRLDIPNSAGKTAMDLVNESTNEKLKMVVNKYLDKTTSGKSVMPK